MSHEDAKLILQQAKTLAERTEAIRRALQLGMTLVEIEEYLDWLDHVSPMPEAEDSPGP